MSREEQQVLSPAMPESGLPPSIPHADPSRSSLPKSLQVVPVAS